MFPERIRTYSLKALAATPAVMTRLLDGITDEEADRRPDPERFTIREALAHVADWDPIWHERLVAITEKDDPRLPGYDEGQWAIDHDYAHSKVSEQLEKFRQARAALVAFAESVPNEAWYRKGHHDEIGALTFGELIMLVLAHDGYHTKQFVDFREW